MFAENDNRAVQRRLTSWKEIATYVGRNERTVKRWEASRGFPVRRVAGASRGSVFAYADEIEAWMHGHAASADVTKPSLIAPEPEQKSDAPSRRVAFPVFLLMVAIAVIALVYFGRIAPSPAPPAVLHTHDPVAANLYQVGLHAWQTRTPSGLNRAISQFRQAVARDPRFAEAYVGLADAYDLQGEFTAVHPDRVYPEAADAARRAITLDPSLAGAHAALAFAEFYGSRNVGAAEKEFRRAITLDPRSAVAHHWYATFLMTIGNFAAAISEIDKAENLDAESMAIPADKGLILYHAGRKADGIRLLKQIEEDNPAFASTHKYLATIRFAEGNDASYVRELKLAALARHDDAGNMIADAAAKGLAMAGHGGMLRASLDAEEKLYGTNRVSAYSLAETCAELGDETCTRSYLAISIARQEVDNIALNVDPPFARFSKNSWFETLRAQAGLPQPDSGAR
jgi:tetratricopeptide (TPR) repeat protein/predicted DNA-binding transcriptional regulator AlpA